jgi:hypothetical protein
LEYLRARKIFRLTYHVKNKMLLNAIREKLNPLEVSKFSSEAKNQFVQKFLPENEVFLPWKFRTIPII